MAELTFKLLDQHINHLQHSHVDLSTFWMSDKDYSMGTLGNVPLASAHGRCTVAALSCIEWKAHHKFRMSLVDI